MTYYIVTTGSYFKVLFLEGNRVVWDSDRLFETRAEAINAAHFIMDYIFFKNGN